MVYNNCSSPDDRRARCEKYRLSRFYRVHLISKEMDRMTNKKFKLAAMSLALTACVAASPLSAGAEAPADAAGEPAEAAEDPKDAADSAEETAEDADAAEDAETPEPPEIAIARPDAAQPAVQPGIAAPAIQPGRSP